MPSTRRGPLFGESTSAPTKRYSRDGILRVASITSVCPIFKVLNKSVQHGCDGSADPQASPRRQDMAAIDGLAQKRVCPGTFHRLNEIAAMLTHGRPPSGME